MRTRMLVTTALTLPLAAALGALQPGLPAAAGRQLAAARTSHGPGRVAAPSQTLLAAGDVSCNPVKKFRPSHSAVATAKVLTAAIGAHHHATVAALGDEVNGPTSDESFAQCYNPTWGRYRSRTRPTPGNWEYVPDHHAGPYFSYFGHLAGQRGKGYYDYQRGAWHIIVLNSNCRFVTGGCGSGSPQETWLRHVLKTHAARCTLAYWHNPLFSSGRHGDNAAMRPAWNDLFKAHADVVLGGHWHQYERFARQTPSGKRSTAGMREFVVGTGGARLHTFATVKANSEVRNNTTFGVLQLTLGPAWYRWQFLPVAGKTFTDSGFTPCH